MTATTNQCQEWRCSLDDGCATLAIYISDGKIDKQTAQDVLDWFEVIAPRLKRLAKPESADVPQAHCE